MAHLYTQKPVNTYLLTPEGQLHFQPLSIDQADHYFAQLLQVWWQAMHEPLPLSLQLGMKLVAPKEATDAAKDKALADDLAYGSQYMQRHFPTMQDLDIQRCTELATAVYEPWQACVKELT